MKYLEEFLVSQYKIQPIGKLTYDEYCDVEAKWYCEEFQYIKNLTDFMNEKKLGPDRCKIIYDSGKEQYLLFYFSCCE